MNATASVLANNASTVPVTITSSPSARVRPNAQTHTASPAPAPRKREAIRAPTVDFEEENEEDEAPPDEEDNNPYCYCHQPSHGEVCVILICFPNSWLIISFRWWPVMELIVLTNGWVRFTSL